MPDIKDLTEKTLPPNGTRCTDVLSDALKGNPGIHTAEFDLYNGNLRVAYDPGVLNGDLARQLVRQAGETAMDRVYQCRQVNDENCQACLVALENGLVDYYKRIAHLQVEPRTNYNDGVMEIHLGRTSSGHGELAQVERSISREAEVRRVSLPSLLTRKSVEIAFTAITAIAALSAFFGERFGLFPPLMVSLLYTLAYATGGYYGLLDGLALLRKRRLDVNFLMIAAALGAAAIGQPAEGAVLLFLFSLSNSLQTFAMDRSRKAIEKLLDLRPSVATVRRGSRLMTMPIDKVTPGDVVLVRPGERIPMDGDVIAGSSTVDQSPITGESLPVEKEPGSQVFAGTVNGNGSLEIRVTRLAKDSTLAKIVQMVEHAQGNKAQTQRMLDNYEQGYALLVLSGAALLTIIPYFFLGLDFHPTFYRAMTWLVVASPCALVISTPASILSAIANGARRGVLFKGGVHLEQAAKIKVVAFDKTGTLTTGLPSLTAIIPHNGVDGEDLLRLAAAVESRSEHPLAGAILKAAEERQLDIPHAFEFQAFPGQGVKGYVDGRSVLLGNEGFFKERDLSIPQPLIKQARHLETAGQTVMFANAGGQWMGLLAVADTLRPDSPDIVRRLKERGVERVVMLTGDNQRVAAGIARKAGVDEYHADLLPQDKVRLLKNLRKKYGPVAMVGDGINDAPALAVADIGIAMGGAGTDVALETADIVLMADDLRHLPYAIGLAHRTQRTVWQNLAFSMAVIILLVITAFGADLPLPLGVIGHEGSTVIVVLNGLRLLGYRG